MKRTPLLYCTLAGVLAMGLATFGAGSARADLKVTYGDNFFAFNGSNAGSAYQGAVNKNIGSPYYGYLYVADGTLNKIWICPPLRLADGTGANAYDQDGAPAANPPTKYINVPGGNLTMGVAVGDDDTVWIGSLNAGKVYSAPPVPAAGDASVDAVAQISGVGSVRGVTVTGPVTNAKVYVAAQSPAKASLYTVEAPNASTAGAATNVYIRDLSVAPYSLATGNGVYTVAADLEGNAYVANGIGVASITRIYKILPDGTVDPNWKALAPAGLPAMSALVSAAFVADKSYTGGGYLYFNSMTGTGAASGQWNLRFDLNGNYLDGWGPAVATPPANYSVITFRGTTQPTFLSADDLGNTYQRSANTAGNSGTVKVFKRAPYLAAAADAKSAPAAIKSSPTAVDGVVYFGDDSGRLHAYTTEDGNPVANFPVDVNFALDASGVKIQSRAAVYITAAGKGIYFTTDRGDVCRINADGSGFASYSGSPSSGVTSTPAVLPDGTVFVGVNGPTGVQVIKLNSDMTFNAASPVLASGSVTSVAVNGANIYVGLTGGSAGDIVVLKTSDLTPQAAGVAGGESVTAPPFVEGANAYVGTLAGNFYKVNSVTFAPDPAFGSAGKAAIGEPLPGSAFNDGSVFFVGSSNGKVWQVNAFDGSFNVLYDTGDAGAAISGVVVNDNTLAFGTNVSEMLAMDGGSANAFAVEAPGLFYQVPTDVLSGPVNAQVFRGYSAFTTTPTFDRKTKRFLIGSDDQNVYAFSSR